MKSNDPSPSTSNPAERADDAALPNERRRLLATVGVAGAAATASTLLFNGLDA